MSNDRWVGDDSYASAPHSTLVLIPLSARFCLDRGHSEVCEPLIQYTEPHLIVLDKTARFSHGPVSMSPLFVVPALYKS